jgi:hypothetical protein
MTRFRFVVSSSHSSRPETIEVRGTSEADAWARLLLARPDALAIETTQRMGRSSAGVALREVL